MDKSLFERVFFPIDQFLEVALLLVFTYLVLTRGREFAQIIKALSDAYSKGIRSLQGRS